MIELRNITQPSAGASPFKLAVADETGGLTPPILGQVPKE
jgi:hypothetical protein